jgi:hypothetical protein
MNVIDFFGCSFTEAPKLPYNPSVDKFDIELYSMHCHVTKPMSGFLEFDMAYNNCNDYQINNYGKGSFGNFTIKNVITNKVKKLNKEDNNIAIVQLSALLRNEHSWECIQEKGRYQKEDKEVFDIDFNAVKPDYIVEVSSMEEYYQSHIDNLKSILSLLKENYNRYIIFFGWDVSTKEFAKVANEVGLYDEILNYTYDYPLSKREYFENNDSFNDFIKRCRGKRGGLLEYSANKLPEEIRYAGERDHHPSYFSNKIFYEEIIKPFLKVDINLDKEYFNEDVVIQFEEFLKELCVKKLKGGEWENYNYPELQMETIGYVRNTILKK